MVPGASKIIAVAERYIGMKEDPIGSNNGPEIRHVLRNTSFVPGESWCFYFAVACLQEALGGNSNLPLAVLNTGSCQLAADYAARQRRLTSYPATGCIFVLPNEAGHFHHAGIVTGVDDKNGMVMTIEGNSNNTGSPNGWEVVRHTRRTSSVSFIVWEHLP